MTSQYLAKADALLQKLADDNERMIARGERLASARLRRMEIAEAYARLAAIDKGLLPKQVADELYGQWAGER